MADAKIDTVEFERRLRMIETVFSFKDLDRHGKDLADIIRYYRHSSLGYRFVHSESGAMHMALNPDGVFDETGYYGQANAVEALIDPQARRVLELASGKGFNSNYLAGRHPDMEFFGIDLVPSQVIAARKRANALPNVRYLTADFQFLPFSTSSLDAVFVVESLCHALDMPQALDEVARVLREEGIFIVVDAWRTSAFETFPEIVKRAAEIIERAMAVGHVWRTDEWLSMIDRSGFKVVADRDLTASVMANMRRFERMAIKYFRHPRLARLSTYLLPSRLLQNSVAALLLPISVEAGAHNYRLIALKKR